MSKLEEGLRELDHIVECMEYVGLTGSTRIKAAAKKIREGIKERERS